MRSPGTAASSRDKEDAKRKLYSRVHSANSVRVISVRFKAVKVAVMNTFKELKETMLEELKEGTKAVFHQTEYQ